MHIRVYEIPIPKRNESTVESFQTVCNLANASMRLTRYRDFERFSATRSPPLKQGATSASHER